MKVNLRPRVKERYWLAGVATLFVFLLFQHEANVIIDRNDQRPLFSPIIEIIPGDPPLVAYCANARLDASGFWTAVIYSEDGIRGESRSGWGDYQRLKACGDPWTWDAFWTDKKNPDRSNPEVPTEPFKVCVAYVVWTIRSDLRFSIPETCSEVYYP